MPPRLLDRLGDRAGFGDDLEASRRSSKRDQALADDLVIVDDEESATDCGTSGLVMVRAPDAMGTRMLRVVPSPSVLSMVTVPPNAAARSCRLARPRCAAEIGRGLVSNPTPSSSTLKDDRVAVDPHHDPRSLRARVARGVAERFAGHLQQLDPMGRREARRELRVDRQVELDIGCAGRAELVGKRRHAGQQVGAVEQLRAQAEDEVADLADRQVERIDRPIDARAGLVGLVGHHRGNILERQRDPVDRLDHAVVEVPCDPFPFLDHGRRETCSWSLAFSIAMPARSANISTSNWSVSLNSAAPLLVGQVQVPDRATLGHHRNAQE